MKNSKRGSSSFYTHCKTGDEKLDLHIITNAILMHAKMKSLRSNFCSLDMWITHTHVKAVWNSIGEGIAQQHKEQRKYTKCRQAIVWCHHYQGSTTHPNTDLNQVWRGIRMANCIHNGKLFLHHKELWFGL